jgi:DNA primase
MTGSIPQAFIDELISRVDIVELVDEFLPLKKAGTSYTACCPFHQEKTPSFNVIPHKQFFYCFGCGASGNAIKFLMQFLQIGFPQAIKELADKLGLQIPENTNATPNIAQQHSQNLLSKIKQYYRQALYKRPTEVIGYLKTRQLSQRVIDEFELGYAPQGWQDLQQTFPRQNPALLETGMIIENDSGKYYDRFRHRLMFPLYNRQGKLIGFAGRVISPEHKPKYMNSPETSLFHKQKELYGLYHVLKHHPKPPYILVVEGYLDVISLFQFDLPYAVATMGTATSHYHLQILHKYTDEIIFCFDGDDAGRQAAWRALENAVPSYNHIANIRFLFLPQNHDPDSIIRANGLDGFNTLIAKAIPLHQYFQQEMLRLYGKSGQQKLILEAKKYLDKLDDGPGKDLLIESLASQLRLDPYRLRQWLSTAQQTQEPQQQKQQQTSPMRLALSLLLQHPELLLTLPLETQEILKQAYPEPLGIVIDSIQNHPKVSTASLVQHFQETPFYDAFNKLAIFNHQIEAEKRASTLEEVFDFLGRKQENEKIDSLILQLKQVGLSDADKVTLQRLLQKRHQTKPH